jgi:hypothetical protein
MKPCIVPSDPRFKFFCNYFQPKSEAQPVLHNMDIAGLVKLGEAPSFYWLAYSPNVVSSITAYTGIIFCGVINNIYKVSEKVPKKF